MLQPLLAAEGLHVLVAVGVAAHPLEGSGSTMLHREPAGAVLSLQTAVAVPGEDQAGCVLPAGRPDH